MPRTPRPPKYPEGRSAVCSDCTTPFFFKGSGLAPKRCLKCREAWHASKRHPCLVCEKPVIKRRLTCQTRECQRSWRSIRQRGEKSHLWQGGKATTTTLLRGSIEYALWRDAVYERDDFTCQLCSSKGGKLAAHHIYPFSERPDLRLVLWNGITLCWPCHSQIRWKEADYVERFLAVTKGRLACA
jgi:5-methylcytosine-specific restriction endonuclease McrA